MWYAHGSQVVKLLGHKNSFFCRESRSLRMNMQAEQTFKLTDYRKSEIIILSDNAVS